MTETIEKSAALEMIQKFCMGYLATRIDGLWGEHGTRGQALRFTTGAYARLGQIFGWICGVAGTNQALAERLAKEIIDSMDYLSNYGGPANNEQFSPPAYIVQLGDDGTFNGFTVLWYRARTEDEVADLKARFDANILKSFNFFEDANHNPIRLPPHARYKEGITEYRYVYNMNGGLLYHGPGGQEVFAVNFGNSNFWGIHT